MDSITVLSLFFLLANLVFFGASSALNRTVFFECLTIEFQSSNSDSDVIRTPNEASYSSSFQSAARNERAVLRYSQRPLAIITPRHESEIQATVHCSKKHGVHIRVRGGGHDYEGLSYTSEIAFVIVDMKNIRSISINTEDDTAWVEAGATLGELYYTIAQTSKTLAFPAGVCPSVGIGGHFSGGGYGMISRKHGVAVDHIIDARLIDVKGRVLDRKEMGEDLFWALRGGGGTSFGIILAFKVKLVRVPEIVTIFNVTRTLEQNVTHLVHKWQYISDTIDENLLLRLFFTSVRSPGDGNKTIAASFTSLFLGRVEDLLPIMRDRFPELDLVEHDCVEMSWIESVLFFADLGNQPLDVLLSRSWGIDGLHFKGKSDYVTEPIPEHVLEGMWKFLHELHEKQGQLHFSPHGGTLSTFSDQETPYPHRSGNIYMIHYAVFWMPSLDPTESEWYMNWTRRLYDYLTPYVSKSPRAAYFNYRDLDLGMNHEGNASSGQASVWGFKYFKNNFNRLVRVKTRVDPSNFFRNELSIPPENTSIDRGYDNFVENKPHHSDSDSKHGQCVEHLQSQDAFPPLISW